MSVIVCDLETLKRGGLGPIWAIAPQKKNNYPIVRGVLIVVVYLKRKKTASEMLLLTRI